MKSEIKAVEAKPDSTLKDIRAVCDEMKGNTNEFGFSDESYFGMVLEMNGIEVDAGTKSELRLDMYLAKGRANKGSNFIAECVKIMKSTLDKAKSD